MESCSSAAEEDEDDVIPVSVRAYGGFGFCRVFPILWLCRNWEYGAKGQIIEC